MSVEDYQDELLGLIEADAAFEGCLRRYGAPLSDPKEHDRVYILDEDDFRREPEEQTRIDTFDLRVAIECFRVGKDPRDARDRRAELFDALDALLTATNFHGFRTEGGTLLREAALVAYDKGYIARFIVSIPVEHRF